MTAAARTLDFFVVGAQKCATSWLFYCLQDHPQILMPKKKMEHFYWGGANFWAQGAEAFFSYYPDRTQHKRVGSVSVDYLFDRAALATIIRDFPEARFIACLRNPLQRTASAFHFHVRKGMLPDMSIEAAIDRALRVDQADRSDEAGLLRELVGRSLYARQLEPFAEAGALKRVLLVCYEYLCDRPEEVLRRVYDHIGVEPGVMPRSLSLRPKRSANIPLLTRIQRLAPDSRAMGKVMDHVNQWICRLGLGRDLPAFSAAVERRLRDTYRPDVAKLDVLAGSMPASNRLVSEGFGRQWGFDA